jgi:hypothetical protein
MGTQIWFPWYRVDMINGKVSPHATEQMMREPEMLEKVKIVLRHDLQSIQEEWRFMPATIRACLLHDGQQDHRRHRGHLHTFL